MADWVYAQKNPAEELAQLHYFSFKPKADGEVEFVITVKEFAPRNNVQMRFYAQADKEVNQKTARFRPFGWGESLLAAPHVSLRSRSRFCAALPSSSWRRFSSVRPRRPHALPSHSWPSMLPHRGDVRVETIPRHFAIFARRRESSPTVSVDPTTCSSSAIRFATRRAATSID